VFFHILVSFAVYDIVVWPYQQDFGVNWAVMANIFGFLGLVSLYKTWKTSPGFVEPDWISKVSTDYYSKLPMCETCKVHRPPRSTHCKRLGKCVLRFDHYCPYTANAVGFYNHKFFILLVTYGSVSMTMVQINLGYIFYDYYFYPAPEKNIHWILWYLLFQNGFFCLLCTFLISVQYFLLLNNLTFKEFYVWFRDWNKGKQSLEDFRKFNKGVFTNIKQVMGSDVLLWGCPWKNTLPTNGYVWN